MCFSVLVLFCSLTHTIHFAFADRVLRIMSCYFHLAGRFAMMSYTISDESDNRGYVFAKTSHNCALLANNFLLYPSQAGFCHFVQTAIFQTAQRILSFTTLLIAGHALSLSDSYFQSRGVMCNAGIFHWSTASSAGNICGNFCQY